MFAQPVLMSLNALFLAPAALMGVAATAMLVKLFAVLMHDGHASR